MTGRVSQEYLDLRQITGNVCLSVTCDSNVHRRAPRGNSKQTTTPPPCLRSSTAQRMVAFPTYLSTQSKKNQAPPEIGIPAMPFSRAATSREEFHREVNVKFQVALPVPKPIARSPAIAVDLKDAFSLCKVKSLPTGPILHHQSQWPRLPALAASTRRRWMRPKTCRVRSNPFSARSSACWCEGTVFRRRAITFAKTLESGLHRKEWMRASSTCSENWVVFSWVVCVYSCLHVVWLGCVYISVSKT